MIITTTIFKVMSEKYPLQQIWYILAENNYKVCFIDLDNQANISNVFGIYGNALKKFNWILSSNIHNIDDLFNKNIDLISANSNLLLFNNLETS